MEKGTNGYLLLVVLWFLREGDVTIYGLYCSKRWDNDRIAIERFSDIYFIVILAKYRVACFYENGFYDRDERR